MATDTVQRAIRFRAWTGTQMFYDVGVMPEKSEYRQWFGNDGAMSFRVGTVALMQFTGLKDKNGREIYEGDILRSVGGEIEVVIWTSSGARFTTHPENIDLTELGATYEEVIGNIHENPELLK